MVRSKGLRMALINRGGLHTKEIFQLRITRLDQTLPGHDLQRVFLGFHRPVLSGSRLTALAQREMSPQFTQAVNTCLKGHLDNLWGSHCHLTFPGEISKVH